MKPREETPTKLRIQCICILCFQKWTIKNLKKARNRAERRKNKIQIRSSIG